MRFDKKVALITAAASGIDFVTGVTIDVTGGV